MARKSFSRTDRVRLFDLHGRKCHLCDQKIKVGEPWELEHIVPWELTRDDSDDNVKPAHTSCHKEKTANDVAAIRKADRIRAKHIGVKPPSTFRCPPSGMKFNWKTGRYERAEQ